MNVGSDVKHWSGSEKQATCDYSGQNKNMDPILGENDSELAKSETGTYEAAIGSDIYGPEFDLHTSKTGQACQKHPGHKGFIPIKEFTIDHLPEDCPGKEWYFDRLKSWANLVVHISALNVSTERPKNFPLFEHRGGCMPRNGSGCVWDVYLSRQSGQGVEKITYVIEQFLDDCKLSDLDGETFDSMTDHWSTSQNLVQTLRWYISQWLKDNYLDFAHDELDNFTKDLIHQIKTCKEIKNDKNADNLTEGQTGLTTTLNDFRKTRGLSVTDFCVSMSRGLVVNWDFKMRFWDTFGTLIDKPCPCHECRQSGNPKKTWWSVLVRTAAHVIFDGHEAEGAEVSLFYDDDVSKRVTMRGISGTYTHWTKSSFLVETDSSIFFCSLHDDNAGERLKSTKQSLDLQYRYTYDLKYVAHPERGPTAVIAHPHGATKQISIGTGWETSLESEEGNFMITRHTAPTCPGSSGGAVVRLGHFIHPHSQAVKTHLSKCGFHYGYRYMIIKALL